MKYRHAGLNYGGFDGDSSFNLMFSIFPVDMLQINFLFRGFDKAVEATERLATMQLFASYKIEEVGTIRFAAVGNGGLKKDAADDSDIATLHLAFYSNELAQGVAFEIGGQYNLPHLNTSNFDPIRIAAGLNLTATDPFNFKFRGGVALGGKKADKDLEMVGFSVGILPSYKFAKLTAFLQAGIGMEIEPDKDTNYSWFVNPYIWVPMGGMRMWVGLQIIDEHAIQDGRIKWCIPFGFNFYF